MFLSLFATATPNNPLSSAFDTLTSSNGSDNIEPFTTLSTMPVFFSRTKIVSLPKNAMLEGVLRPSKTVSTFREGSITDGLARVYIGKTNDRQKNTEDNTIINFLLNGI